MAKAKDTPQKQVAKGKETVGHQKVFSGVVSEIKKVTWPTRKGKLMNTTVVVLVFILVFSVVVGLIDLGLGKLLELIT